MSTVSLPSYIAPSVHRAPSYSAEPNQYEQRLAFVDRLRARPSSDFVKESKGGGVRLRLSAQDDNASLPVYGLSDVVEGTVELTKTEAVTCVEVKIEGRLKLKEIAEGGTAIAKLCLDTALLWVKDQSRTECPTSLQFALALPSTFEYEEKTYPLPPTFGVKLSGLPGFVATIDYTVTAIVEKPNGAPVKLKSKALGIHVGTTHVTTPFVYFPRSRPASPIPHPLQYTPNGFVNTPDWKLFESVLYSKSPARPNINVKFYIPAARVFCMTKSIPFHLSLESSSVSLAAFLPLSPSANTIGRKATRVQLMRQTTVDVRNTVIAGVKTDMWRVDCIGEGIFKHAVGDAPTCISYSGEIPLTGDDIKVPGFKAAGLSVKDCVLLTMNPTDPSKSPFSEIREVIPVRLSTDPWMANGSGLGARRESLLQPPTPPTPSSD
ncbi:hypothetical protein JR316_0007233 [Psilocybe cubensis]|uniref:Uncharacterized protein n=2 Tax=Psilocybe cubensis TaxID=181762 RepID=A0A8H7XTJ1_PSICU|nr:hypothetical protein JR316_0007233 [Psilocybe cubensis]KAH9480633.1 hypothetical protein JR316_0007233 [Psilocybe cubensis]